jgi:DNA-binding NarL/FixJ family response regulator
VIWDTFDFDAAPRIPIFSACLTDGRDAIERARELHPDILLLDLAMPDMNGFDTPAS